MKKLLLLAAAFAAFCSASALTYNVTVPAGTKACYIAGEMTVWAFTEMTKVNETTYTVEIATATAADKYKYCSGPSWDYVEKTAGGADVQDREYSSADVVEKWAAIYDPGEVATYVDITVMINYAEAPTIWWWGAGDQCPNAADLGYSWPGPDMEEVEGAAGWYKWDFNDVKESLGVTFKIDGDALGELKTTESACYNEAGQKTLCPVITAADEAQANAAEVVGVFNMIGQPVSAETPGLKIFVYSDGTTEKKY